MNEIGKAVPERIKGEIETELAALVCNLENLNDVLDIQENLLAPILKNENSSEKIKDDAKENRKSTIGKALLAANYKHV